MSMLEARLGAEMLKGRVHVLTFACAFTSFAASRAGVLGISSGAPECPARPLRQQGDLELPILLPTLSVGITGKHLYTVGF